MEKGGTKFLICILVVLILVAGGVLGYKILRDKNNAQNQTETQAEEADEALVTEIKQKEIKTFKGNDRPVAIMYDNHNQAWPQAGLNKAYLVYEIIVEGGETRLMALYKGADVSLIGPVRSARHYFLDYAMENDAIYVHFGWSPQAESDIKKYAIHNINGIYEDGSTFWRSKEKYAQHNAVTSMKNLLQSAKTKGYRTTSEKESVLKYTADEINLEDARTATSITIPHSDLQTVKYEYDEENKVYKRFARNKQQTDWETSEPIITKNVIITKCDNYTLQDTENKGRQGLKNIGTFDGYYLTNGKVIEIKCIKNARNEKTVYQDLEGNEIQVNDGNTWINICPVNANIVIEPAIQETPVENTANVNV